MFLWRCCCFPYSWNMVNLSVSDLMSLHFSSFLQPHSLFIDCLVHSLLSFGDFYNLKFELQHSGNLWTFSTCLGEFLMFSTCFLSLPLISPVQFSAASVLPLLLLLPVLIGSWLSPFSADLRAHQLFSLSPQSILARLIHLTHKSGYVVLLVKLLVTSSLQNNVLTLQCHK